MQFIKPIVYESNKSFADIGFRQNKTYFHKIERLVLLNEVAKSMNFVNEAAGSPMFQDKAKMKRRDEDPLFFPINLISGKKIQELEKFKLSLH
jgi:hypothetical protein